MKSKLLSAFVTVCLIASAGVAYVLTSEDAPTYTVTADVEQAPNLFEHGRVMVRGVEVGEIVGVEPRSDAVRVTIEIRADVKIPADARLAVVPITVIADRYVQFYPAYSSGPALADGDHLGLEKTSIPAELDDVLAQLKGLLSALEPRGNQRGPLAKLITGLDEALDGRSAALAGSIEGSATVLENLADSDADIVALIENLDGLFAALANRSSQLALLNERFALVAESLVSDQDNLEGTLENLTLLSNESSALVTETGDDLGRSFARLDRVLNTILEHEDSLTIGIKWTNVIAQALGETDASGRGTYAYSGRQAAPGTARAAYNYRIDTRDTIGCERLGVIAQSILSVRPDASLEDITQTVLNFIPDVYDDDLRFLVEQLIPLCTDYQEPAMGPRAKALVRRVAERVGEKRFRAMLGRWLVAGFTAEAKR